MLAGRDHERAAITALLDRARAGNGGALGTSIAYHLAKAGEKDVLLLEKNVLTAGSTWHAAGLMGQLRSKVNLTRLMQYSADLCARSGAETGQGGCAHALRQKLTFGAASALGAVAVNGVIGLAP